MPKFQIINSCDAKLRLKKENIKIVDIRDELTYKNDHIKGAIHLSNNSIPQFMQEVDLNTPIFVICYHGNSSKGVAQYLCAQGYQEVYSVAGGMVDWRLID